CRKQLVIPRWPFNVYDDENPAGIDTTLWDSPQFARIPSESTCFWMFRDAVELSKNRVIPRILPLDAAIKNAHFWIRVPPGTFGDIDVPKGTHDC
ncbi:hypothetical protein, partial [Microbacterium sp. NPDC064584]|uniref:hypothetical protein n=1 Tax=Microbacterium sp. NPDC064584 TaxID=3155817 RepID=UPI00342BA667